MNAVHLPVLLTEAVSGLRVEADRTYIDATLGGGGHSEEILRRGGNVLAIDRDGETLAETGERLGRMYGTQRFTAVRGNYSDLVSIARTHGANTVAGVLFDLGISSIQLDTPDRGFSYRFTDAPLDLRMDRAGGDTAAQLVNRLSERELYGLFERFGEEQRSGAIAHALVVARGVKPIVTAGDLAESIATVVPNERDRPGIMSRIYQALRIEVNDELESLKLGLQGAETVLERGGRLVVISFHSLEDRIVKQFMRSPAWNVLTRHPVTSAAEELERNRRARSAKLRIAEKL